MQDESKKNTKHYIRKIKKFILPSIIFIIILILLIKYFRDYYGLFKNPENIKNIILRYDKHAKLVFVLMQIVQVIIFVIPGEVIQIAGGYIFGPFLGTILSIIGIAIGSSAAFMLSKKLGRRFVNSIISEEKVEYYESKLKKTNLYIMIFILYLIPGIPKDALAYISGITHVKYKEFITYSTLGRIPAILVSSYFGHNIVNGNKASIIVISIVITVIILIVLINKEKIINAIEKKHKKV